VTIRAENDAETFLWLKRQDNVKESQRVAYSASIAGRNRFRTAAAVGVAGAFGMFITGLFLHELDQPRSSVHRRDDLPRPAERSTSVPRFSFVSSAPASDVGASVQVNF